MSHEDHTMIPYLHFTGGDNLFFESWKPTSAGAIAGACIALIAIALLERGLAAYRGIMEANWRAKALAIVRRQEFNRTRSPDHVGHSSQSSEGGETKPLQTQRPARERKIAPFIPAHDFARGGVYAAQTLLGYILMLAVMSFNASYIMAILMGLVIGEIAFGRLGGQGAGH